MKEIIKCSQYDLMKAKAKLGQMYFVTDRRILYKDIGSNIEQRLVFNAVIINNETERLNYIKPVIGKFYYVEDTNCLWQFDTRWVLKIGNNTNYNSFQADKYISPVINTDSNITNSKGDIIIDNNGLLGNGSVVIRDNDRIIRNTISANLTYNRIELKSYLDDGFLFIPNSHLPYTDLSTSLGALHLTVEKKDINNSSSLKLNGAAHYYGTWNNYGDMYLIQKQSSNNIRVDYIPVNDLELVKFYITCSKHTSEGTFTTYMVIRPLSTTSALCHVITIMGENSSSVVQNDMGELIFTNHGDLIENNIYECKRRIINTDKEYRSEYILDKYDAIISLIQFKESMSYDAIISNEWADENGSTIITSDKWIKDKVLTSSELDVSETFIKRIT